MKDYVRNFGYGLGVIFTVIGLGVIFDNAGQSINARTPIGELSRSLSFNPTNIYVGILILCYWVWFAFFIFGEKIFPFIEEFTIRLLKAMVAASFVVVPIGGFLWGYGGSIVLYGSTALPNIFNGMVGAIVGLVGISISNSLILMLISIWENFRRQGRW